MKRQKSGSGGDHQTRRMSAHVGGEGFALVAVGAQQVAL
jgi:hypothetical protein